MSISAEAGLTESLSFQLKFSVNSRTPVEAVSVERNGMTIAAGATCAAPRQHCTVGNVRSFTAKAATVVLIQRRLEEARVPSLLYFNSAFCASEV